MLECRLSAEDLVIEKYYEKVRVSHNIKSIRNWFLVGLFAYLLIASVVMYLNELSLFYVLIFLIPAGLFYMSAPWFAWRFSVIGYQAEYHPVSKKIEWQNENLCVRHERTDASGGFSRESVIHAANELVQIVDTPEYIVLLFDHAVEMIKRDTHNRAEIEEMIVKTKLVAPSVNNLAERSKKNIFF
ncbi:MAG: hypothetical protein H6985_14040 [Pseudomonadales bacterium]|nr:hypothetical protein [Pseudomonadales bacterium]